MLPFEIENIKYIIETHNFYESDQIRADLIWGTY